MLNTRDRAASVDARPPQSSGMTASRDSHVASGGAGKGAEPVASLENFLRDTRFDPNDPVALGDVLRALVERGDDRAPNVPLPGHGETLVRWRTLAAVAACDLGLVKLFEGHTDALAILAELQGPTPPVGSRWGVWAAEPPDARVQAIKVGIRSDGEDLRLTGTKAWCSGARVVTHALVTAWLDDEPVLAAVAMDQPSISIDTSKWQAVGMQATASADVTFDQASATLVGGAHSYVRRPGFWHGGAGIAACWYGAAAQIGRMLRDACTQRADPHRLAHLGAVEVALAGAAAVLRETAAHIDAYPLADSQRETMRARLVVEEASTAVMNHATRTLGAGPLCRNARFARALADLPVFLRQSHAERDLAALGELIAAAGPADGRDGPDAGGAPWML
ncbi:acyl-CoA dehydrogenase family protein [Paraburkholderia aromaticivorans]|uniref:acyl-CoA dehydrogenase family protein n=1 Tax=Paraburkholderia aromaticivorans TaxID=2026199 RepID=UPI001455F2D9|nr:acyl-CoA dehydrogenase family protein [Paraburkholderia aromaticivorans]